MSKIIIVRTRFFILEVIHIRNLEERRETIDSLIEFIKAGAVSREQKEIIYKIVLNMKKSDLQKRRFCMIYSFGPNIDEKNTYKKVAAFYDCSISNIRGSVMSIVAGFIRLPDEQFNVLKRIVEDCKLKNETK